MTPNNTVYKLIGTALVKQDQTEAKANVKKRLEFIQGEMYAEQISLHMLISFADMIVCFLIAARKWKIRLRISRREATTNATR